jgi:hypothetical protein
MRVRTGALAILLAAPMALAAQDIPPYVPANPILESRSALYAQPYISAQPAWQWRVLSDYYNAVEVSTSDGPLSRQYIFDAEVLQADVWVTRDLGHHLFILADVPLRGGYNGFLDGFLIWYHHLTGLEVPARDELPRDHFQWGFVLPDSNINRSNPGTFLGDVRGGAGWREGRVEVIATATVPTATIGEDGWSRHVVGTSVALSAAVIRNSRIALDASASAGYTPANGALSPYQRTGFISGLLSARWRFAGRQALFFGAWSQSPSWHDTGFHAMDDHEVSADFGFLLHPGRRWPELQLGMTQDLEPRGPALDVGFSVGLRWGVTMSDR